MNLLPFIGEFLNAPYSKRRTMEGVYSETMKKRLVMFLITIYRQKKSRFIRQLGVGQKKR